MLKDGRFCGSILFGLEAPEGACGPPFRSPVRDSTEEGRRTLGSNDGALIRLNSPSSKPGKFWVFALQVINSDSAEKPSVHPSRTSGRTEEHVKSLEIFRSC
jgi:hypothetical protein